VDSSNPSLPVLHCQEVDNKANLDRRLHGLFWDFFDSGGYGDYDCYRMVSSMM
jgi:hypothetical protein